MKKGVMLMGMETLVNLIMNSGVSIVVIVYFMFRDFKFIQQLNTNIQKMIDVLCLTNEQINKIEKRKGVE